MLVSALVFLVLAVLVTLLGAAAPWDQGLPEIMFWFAAVSLAVAAGLVFGHIGHYDADDE